MAPARASLRSGAGCGLRRNGAGQHAQRLPLAGGDPTNYYDQYRFADVFANLKRAPESLADEIHALPGVAQVRTRVVAEVTLHSEAVKVKPGMTVILDGWGGASR